MEYEENGREYEEKSKNRSKEDERKLMEGLMKIFEEFGEIKDKESSSGEAQAQVKKLQSFITENMYTCTDEILFGLGKMYAGGGEFTQNIDKFGGAGTAEFAYKAIKKYCGK